MARLVLRIQRCGHVIGSWPLGDDPLELILVDPATGRRVAEFTVRGSVRDADSPAPVRIESHGFTLSSPASVPRAEGRVIPFRETTAEVLAQIAPPQPRRARRVRQRRARGGLPRHDATTECASRPVPVPRPAPAEVWVRKRGEWEAAGHLLPGQRVRFLGAKVRLATDGRLVITSGSDLSGSATLIDGRVVDIPTGQTGVSVAPGSSVLLRSGARGIYVRSEVVSVEAISAARA